MAPERAQGQEPGPASDVWALGATLYAVVEGAPPFRRTSTWSTLTAIVVDPLPEPGRRQARPRPRSHPRRRRAARYRANRRCATSRARPRRASARRRRPRRPTPRRRTRSPTPYRRPPRPGPRRPPGRAGARPCWPPPRWPWSSRRPA
ncbi:hypothetical protein [Streptomyces sp. NRRL B-1347]|uniref:hypothetical protein n=1 Tax=Streptomyces sp. NRRL B-1347 TaxID=1476877 RepID=UPI00227731FE|nr:hypothetical protein [Streptomyces sp. NRRL B-1347]